MMPSNTVPNWPRPLSGLLLLVLLVCAALLVRHLATAPRPANLSFRQGLFPASPPAQPTLALGPPARLETGGDSKDGPAAPAHPATQGLFTLASISRADGTGNFRSSAQTSSAQTSSAPTRAVSPPRDPGLPAFAFLGSMTPAQPDSTGLGITINGGIGVKTISLPPGLSLHSFGRFTLACLVQSQGQGSSTTWLGWCDTQNLQPIPESEQPYQAEVLSQYGPAGVNKPPQCLLVPRDLNRRFHFTVQPLDRAGKPLGSGLRLACRPLSRNSLFVSIPGGYSGETKSLDVSLTCPGKPGQKALWRLGDLPPSRQIDDHPAPAPRQTVGPVTVEAVAMPTVSEDSWGDLPQPAFQSSERGLPTLHCRLRAVGSAQKNPAKDPQAWEVQVHSVTPQWTPATPSAAPPQAPNGRPALRAVLPVWSSQYPGVNWAPADLPCGPAYPGHQRFVRVQADAVRYKLVTEPLTFHDADVRLDPATRQWQIAWRQAQTLSTPSGIAVCALNLRPNAGPDPARNSPSPFASFGTAQASLLLAYRLPPGMGPPGYGPGGFPAQMLGIEIQKPFGGGSAWGQPRLDWSRVWLPGAPLPIPHVYRGHSPLFSMQRDHYEPLSLTVLPPSPPVPPPYRFTSAPLPPVPAPPPAASFPSHLSSLTLLIHARVEAERHPFTLIVPVTSKLPTNWPGDVARPAPTPYPMSLPMPLQMALDQWRNSHRPAPRPSFSLPALVPERGSPVR